MYTVMSILDDTIFRRFNTSDSAKRYYLERLERFCTDTNVLNTVCMDLADSAKSVPSITEIKKMYREIQGVKQKAIVNEAFVPTDKDTEAKKRFLFISAELRKGKKYNQICWDNGWHDWLSTDCQDPKELDTENNLVVESAHRE